jgi:penicillin-binding protein 1A
LSGELQGGSTLTQQLARNLFPEEIGRAATLTRKLKEAITALKIEAVYSKREILETYLNTVPFLYNAFGIEMAARTYFDTSADKLDVLESATLIGMLKGTSYYNPVQNPERARQRRNLVLEQMAKNGKLEPARVKTLSKRPIKLDFERQIEAPGPAPHVAQYLRKWLIDWADRRDYDLQADGRWYASWPTCKPWPTVGASAGRNPPRYRLVFWRSTRATALCGPGSAAATLRRSSLTM